MKEEKLDNLSPTSVNRAPFLICGSSESQRNIVLGFVIDSVETVCLNNISGSGLKPEDAEYARLRLRALRGIRIEDSEAIGEAVFKADQLKPNYLNLLLRKFAFEKPEPAHLWVDNTDEENPAVYMSKEIIEPLGSSDKHAAVRRANGLMYSLMPFSLRLMRQKNPITDQSKKNNIKSYLEGIYAQESDVEKGERDSRAVEGIEVINGFLDESSTEVFCLGGELVIQDNSCNFRQTLLSALEEDVRDYLRYPLSESGERVLKQKLNIDYSMGSDANEAKKNALNRLQKMIEFQILEASKKGRINVPNLFRRYVKSELPLAFLR